MNNKKPYCLMPWIHFHVGDDGEAKACCVANIKYGNINDQSFDKIWNGKAINEIRTKFAWGIADKRCSHCIKREESGATSIRQETFKNFPQTQIETVALPIYFDIRFSNVCNLKCRTCWHGASSSWFEDAKKLKTNKGHKAVIKNIKDFQSFIDKVGPSLLQAKEIYLAGGEPLVTEEHYLLLQWLIDHKATKIKLRYNTNFTVLKYKGVSVLDLWKEFEQIEILASVDATDDLAKYVRTNSEWDDIVANMKKVQALEHIHLKISPTISVLNIFHLPELINSCFSQKLITSTDIYINILERPIHYNIQSLPIEKKAEVEQKLSAFAFSQTPFLTNQINQIITYMNAKDTSQFWNKFEIENGKLDQLRGETNPLPY